MIQQLVVATIYYLSVMSAAKYRNILLTSHSEGKDIVSESLGSVESSGAEALAMSSLKTESSKVGTSETDSFIPGVEQSILPSSFLPYAHNTFDVSEQVAAALKFVVPFLCQLLLDHKLMLLKVLVGTDGRPLLTDGWYCYRLACILFRHGH